MSSWGVTIHSTLPLLREAKRYIAAGVKTLQIMNGDPTRSGSRLSMADRMGLRRLIRKHRLHVYIHAKFTWNTCGNIHIAKAVLQPDLDLCKLIGGRAVVIHSGHPKAGNDDLCVSAVQKVLSFAAQSGTRVLLETPANADNEVLTCLEDLASVVSQFPAAAIGVCIDTAHVFNVGYDLRTVKHVDRFLILVDTLLPDRVGLIHLNDTPRTCGENGEDRHMRLTDGNIFTTPVLEHFLERTKHIDRVIEWPSDSKRRQD